MARSKTKKAFPLERWDELVAAILDLVESKAKNKRTRFIEKRAGVACALALDGLRVGEICRSPWAHLDEPSRTLRVLPWHDAKPKSKKRPDGRVAGYFPLKDGVERTIDLDSTVIAALRELRESFPRAKRSQWLICTERTSRVKEQEISKFGKLLFRSLNWPLDHCRFHMLRHTSAMKVYRDSGNDIVCAQRHLGHTNPKTTEIYLSLVEDRPESSKVKLRRVG